MKMSMWIACLFLVAVVDGRNVYNLFGKDAGVQSSRTHHLNELLSSLKEEKIFNLDPRSSSLICNACLDVSDQAVKVLEDPDFSEKVQAITAQLCKILPPDMESKCADTLETYFEDVNSYLLDVFDKEHLCYDTGLCPEDAKVTLLPYIVKSQALTVPEILRPGSFNSEVTGSKACATCHNATDAILVALEDPATKIKLIKLLLKACEQVEDHAQQCKKLVFEYAPIILTKVEKYLETNDVCTLAELCQDSPKLDVE